MMKSEKMTELKLSKEESNVFIDIIIGEVHDLVNEWDDDTQRGPSKQRIGNKPIVLSIYEKWLRAQSDDQKITWQTFMLPPSAACTLSLTRKEITCCRNLFKRYIEGIRKYLSQYPQPYTGCLKEIDANIGYAENLLAMM